MAARSSLRDVGRVMNIPLNEVDRVAKVFPSHLTATLAGVLAEKDIDPKQKDVFTSEDKEKAYDFRKMAEEKSEIDDITNFVPVSVAKDSELLVSQYDNSVAEEAGLLKMDFLGLKTLTIIKDALEIIKDRYDVDIDIDAISLEDEKTFELFQRGDMVGIFQYESP
ncbi:unnamed protein product, partial [Darwinula stevensoni]